MLRLLAITIFIILSGAFSQAITVDDAVKTGLSNNNGLQILRIETDIIKGQIEKASLLLPSNPSIEGSISKKDKTLEDGGGKYTNYGLKLSQEFEIAGQRGLRIDITKKSLSKIALDIRDGERILTYDIKDTFSQALILRKKTELARDVVRLQEELLELTKEKYQAGSVSGLEVNLAEVEFSKAKKDLLSMERESRAILLALQGLMGMKPEPGFMVEGELSTDSFSLPDMEALKERLIALRPDLRAAALEVDRTERLIDLAKRESIPNVILGGFYDRDEQKFEKGATISLSIPLFDRKQRERKEATARASQAKLRNAGLAKTVGREIENAYAGFASSLQELTIYKKEIVGKSLENLNLLNLAYKEGKISFFDLRSAQRGTLEIQFAYLDTILRAQNAIHSMEKVVGGDLK
jgi:cobalt-zinc-cadmium efflux system outer membrane protein